MKIFILIFCIFNISILFGCKSLFINDTEYTIDSKNQIYAGTQKYLKKSKVLWNEEQQEEAIINMIISPNWPFIDPELTFLMDTILLIYTIPETLYKQKK